MSKLLTEQQDHLYILTFNCVEKHNAFDDELLNLLRIAIKHAHATPEIRVIVIKANGKHFSAGADLDWMKRMITLSEADNRADAVIFAHILHELYQSTKPTIALVQGTTYGGGIGIIAACDIAIATTQAKFCFSEVSLGLIPAVISPYVIQAIGQRAATGLFLSAEVFNAERAQALHLIHACVKEEDLNAYGLDYAKRIAAFPPQAILAAKALVQDVAGHAIDHNLITKTAELIAQIRVSAEAQEALQRFLNHSSG